MQMLYEYRLNNIITESINNLVNEVSSYSLSLPIEYDNSYEEDEINFDTDIETAEYLVKNFPESAQFEEIDGDGIFLLTNGKALWVTSHEEVDWYLGNHCLSKNGAIRISRCTLGITVCKMPTQAQLDNIASYAHYLCGGKADLELHFKDNSARQLVRELEDEMNDIPELTEWDIFHKDLAPFASDIWNIDNLLNTAKYHVFRGTPTLNIATTIVKHWMNAQETQKILDKAREMWEILKEKIIHYFQNEKIKKDYIEQLYSFIEENGVKDIQQIINDTFHENSYTDFYRKEGIEKTKILRLSCIKALLITNKKCSMYVRKDNSIDDIVDMFTKVFEEELTDVFMNGLGSEEEKVADFTKMHDMFFRKETFVNYQTRQPRTIDASLKLREKLKDAILKRLS